MQTIIGTLVNIIRKMQNVIGKSLYIIGILVGIIGKVENVIGKMGVTHFILVNVKSKSVTGNNILSNIICI